jgi:hypothetical protein
LNCCRHRNQCPKGRCVSHGSIACTARAHAKSLILYRLCRCRCCLRSTLRDSMQRSQGEYIGARLWTHAHSVTPSLALDGTNPKRSRWSTHVVCTPHFDAHRGHELKALQQAHEGSRQSAFTALSRGSGAQELRSATVHALSLRAYSEFRHWLWRVGFAGGFAGKRALVPVRSAPSSITARAPLGLVPYVSGRVLAPPEPEANIPLLELDTFAHRDLCAAQVAAYLLREPQRS